MLSSQSLILIEAEYITDWGIAHHLSISVLPDSPRYVSRGKDDWENQALPKGHTCY